MEAEPRGGERQVQLEHHGGLAPGRRGDPRREEPRAGVRGRRGQGGLLQQLHRLGPGYTAHCSLLDINVKVK